MESFRDKEVIGQKCVASDQRLVYVVWQIGLRFCGQVVGVIFCRVVELAVDFKLGPDSTTVDFRGCALVIVI